MATSHNVTARLKIKLDNEKAIADINRMIERLEAAEVRAAHAGVAPAPVEPAGARQRAHPEEHPYQTVSASRQDAARQGFFDWNTFQVASQASPARQHVFNWNDPRATEPEEVLRRKRPPRPRRASPPSDDETLLFSESGPSSGRGFGREFYARARNAASSYLQSHVSPEDLAGARSAYDTVYLASKVAANVKRQREAKKGVTMTDEEVEIWRMGQQTADSVISKFAGAATAAVAPAVAPAVSVTPFASLGYVAASAVVDPATTFPAVASTLRSHDVSPALQMVVSKAAGLSGTERSMAGGQPSLQGLRHGFQEIGQSAKSFARTYRLPEKLAKAKALALDYYQRALALPSHAAAGPASAGPASAPAQKSALSNTLDTGKAVAARAVAEINRLMDAAASKVDQWLKDAAGVPDLATRPSIPEMIQSGKQELHSNWLGLAEKNLGLMGVKDMWAAPLHESPALRHAAVSDPHGTFGRKADILEWQLGQAAAAGVDSARIRGKIAELQKLRELVEQFRLKMDQERAAAPVEVFAEDLSPAWAPPKDAAFYRRRGAVDRSAGMVVEELDRPGVDRQSRLRNAIDRLVMPEARGGSGLSFGYAKKLVKKSAVAHAQASGLSPAEAEKTIREEMRRIKAPKVGRAQAQEEAARRLKLQQITKPVNADTPGASVTNFAAAFSLLHNAEMEAEDAVRYLNEHTNLGEAASRKLVEDAQRHLDAANVQQGPSSGALFSSDSSGPSRQPKRGTKEAGSESVLAGLRALEANPEIQDKDLIQLIEQHREKLGLGAVKEKTAKTYAARARQLAAEAAANIPFALQTMHETQAPGSLFDESELAKRIKALQGLGVHVEPDAAERLGPDALAELLRQHESIPPSIRKALATAGERATITDVPLAQHPGIDPKFVQQILDAGDKGGVFGAGQNPNESFSRAAKMESRPIIPLHERFHAIDKVVGARALGPKQWMSQTPAWAAIHDKVKKVLLGHPKLTGISNKKAYDPKVPAGADPAVASRKETFAEAMAHHAAQTPLAEKLPPEVGKFFDSMVQALEPGGQADQPKAKKKASSHYIGEGGRYVVRGTPYQDEVLEALRTSPIKKWEKDGQGGMRTAVGSSKAFDEIIRQEPGLEKFFVPGKGHKHTYSTLDEAAADLVRRNLLRVESGEKPDEALLRHMAKALQDEDRLSYDDEQLKHDKDSPEFLEWLQSEEGQEWAFENRKRLVRVGLEEYIPAKRPEKSQEPDAEHGDSWEGPGDDAKPASPARSKKAKRTPRPKPQAKVAKPGTARLRGRRRQPMVDSLGFQVSPFTSAMTESLQPRFPDFGTFDVASIYNPAAPPRPTTPAAAPPAPPASAGSGSGSKPPPGKAVAGGMGWWEGGDDDYSDAHRQAWKELLQEPADYDREHEAAMSAWAKAYKEAEAARDAEAAKAIEDAAYKVLGDDAPSAARPSKTPARAKAPAPEAASPARTAAAGSPFGVKEDEVTRRLTKEIGEVSSKIVDLASGNKVTGANNIKQAEALGKLLEEKQKELEDYRRGAASSGAGQAAAIVEHTKGLGVGASIADRLKHLEAMTPKQLQKNLYGDFASIPGGGAATVDGDPSVSGIVGAHKKFFGRHERKGRKHLESVLKDIFKSMAAPSRTPDAAREGDALEVRDLAGEFAKLGQGKSPEDLAKLRKEISQAVLGDQGRPSPAREQRDTRQVISWHEARDLISDYEGTPKPRNATETREAFAKSDLSRQYKIYDPRGGQPLTPSMATGRPRRIGEINPESAEWKSGRPLTASEESVAAAAWHKMNHAGGNLRWDRTETGRIAWEALHNSAKPDGIIKSFDDLRRAIRALGTDADRAAGEVVKLRKRAVESGAQLEEGGEGGGGAGPGEGSARRGRRRFITPRGMGIQYLRYMLHQAAGNTDFGTLGNMALSSMYAMHSYYRYHQQYQDYNAAMEAEGEGEGESPARSSAPSAGSIAKTVRGQIGSGKGSAAAGVGRAILDTVQAASQAAGRQKKTAKGSAKASAEKIAAKSAEVWTPPEAHDEAALDDKSFGLERPSFHKGAGTWDQDRKIPLYEVPAYGTLANTRKNRKEEEYGPPRPSKTQEAAPEPALSADAIPLHEAVSTGPAYVPTGTKEERKKVREKARAERRRAKRQKDRHEYLHGTGASPTVDGDGLLEVSFSEAGDAGEDAALASAAQKKRRRRERLANELIPGDSPAAISARDLIAAGHGSSGKRQKPGHEESGEKEALPPPPSRKKKDTQEDVDKYESALTKIGYAVGAVGLALAAVEVFNRGLAVATHGLNIMGNAALTAGQKQQLMWENYIPTLRFMREFGQAITGQTEQMRVTREQMPVRQAEIQAEGTRVRTERELRERYESRIHVAQAYGANPIGAPRFFDEFLHDAPGVGSGGANSRLGQEIIARVTGRPATEGFRSAGGDGAAMDGGQFARRAVARVEQEEHALRQQAQDAVVRADRARDAARLDEDAARRRHADASESARSAEQEVNRLRAEDERIGAGRTPDSRVYTPSSADMMADYRSLNPLVNPLSNPFNNRFIQEGIARVLGVDMNPHSPGLAMTQAHARAGSQGLDSDPERLKRRTEISLRITELEERSRESAAARATLAERQVNLAEREAASVRSRTELLRTEAQILENRYNRMQNVQSQLGSLSEGDYQQSTVVANIIRQQGGTNWSREMLNTARRVDPVMVENIETQIGGARARQQHPTGNAFVAPDFGPKSASLGQVGEALRRVQAELRVQLDLNEAALGRELAGSLTNSIRAIIGEVDRQLRAEISRVKAGISLGNATSK